MSDVTHCSAVPRSVMIASHIATSAAPISIIPLTSPPGRSRDCINGTNTVHSPGAHDFTVNPYGWRNGVAANRSFSSSIDAAGVFIDGSDRLPSRVQIFRMQCTESHFVSSEISTRRYASAAGRGAHFLPPVSNQEEPRTEGAVSFSRWLDAAAIYVLTMSDLHNTNDKFFIRNRIDNSILALADTILVLPGQFLAAWRSWILG